MTNHLIGFTRMAGMLAAAWALSAAPGLAQTNPDFDVNLSVDYSSAEQTIRLLGDEPIAPELVAGLRGNRIAAATTGFIADREGGEPSLRAYLDSVKYHEILRDDVYHLDQAKQDLADIKALLDELRKRNFSRRVSATVEQIFPQDARISVTMPVYVVALGHENVDAYVRRIAWKDDFPLFVGEGQGEPTIVVNLAHAVHYGPGLQQRFISILGVVAHEVFHAAFAAYKDQSPVWKRYERIHGSPFDELLDLTQNEGIAYYLSLEQQGGGYVPYDWDERTREAFASYNRNGDELLSDTLTPRRASDLIRAANLSGYWSSYGAMTGMFIAREIDRRSGRAALIETIRLGPLDMMAKYLELCSNDSGLPRFSPKIAGFLTSR